MTIPLTAEQSALVEANMGLVPWVLNRRHTLPRDWDDAQQDGMLGLIRAAQKFDPAMGFTFGTYAVQWISSVVAKSGDVNDRREVRGGRPRPDRPLSLDRPADGHHSGSHRGTFDEAPPMVELLAAELDIEADALTAVDHGDLVAKLIAACRDPLDLSIVEAACGPSFSRRSAARDLGITVDQVRTRIARIAARTRHPTARVVQRREVA